MSTFNPNRHPEGAAGSRGGQFAEDPHANRQAPISLTNDRDLARTSLQSSAQVTRVSELKETLNVIEANEIMRALAADVRRADPRASEIVLSRCSCDEQGCSLMVAHEVRDRGGNKLDAVTEDLMEEVLPGEGKNLLYNSDNLYRLTYDGALNNDIVVADYSEEHGADLLHIDIDAALGQPVRDSHDPGAEALMDAGMKQHSRALLAGYEPSEREQYQALMMTLDAVAARRGYDQEEVKS